MGPVGVGGGEVGLLQAGLLLVVGLLLVGSAELLGVPVAADDLLAAAAGGGLLSAWQTNLKPFANAMHNQQIVRLRSYAPRLCAHIAFAREFSVSWGTGAIATTTNGACDASKRPYSAQKPSNATESCRSAAMLSRLRRHRRRAEEGCDWPKEGSHLPLQRVDSLTAKTNCLQDLDTPITWLCDQLQYCDPFAMH